MSYRFGFLALMLLASTSSFAFTRMSGGTDGGGGRGVVCFTDSTQEVIESVEVLDLYEGRMLEGYKIPERSGEYETIYKDVVRQKAADYGIKEALLSANELVEGFKFLPKGVRLNKVDDSSEIFIPSNCSIEQLVNFQGKSRIFVVSDFWNRLSETSKAALLMHEWIWAGEREFGTKTSVRARRTVARFFAEDYDFGKKELHMTQEDYLCTAGEENSEMPVIGASFVLSKVNGGKSCNLTFMFLNNTVTYSQQTAVIEGCELFDFDSEVPQAENSGFAAAANVISHNDNSNTHRIILKTKPGQKNTIDIMNLEFPGFDQKNLTLTCGKLRDPESKP